MMASPSKRRSLCDYCQNLIDDFGRILNNEAGELIGSHTYPYHAEVPSIVQSISVHGCRICWLLLQYINDHPERLSSTKPMVAADDRVSSILRLEIYNTDTTLQPFHCSIRLQGNLTGNDALHLRDCIEIRPDLTTETELILTRDEDGDEKATLEVSMDYKSSLELANRWFNDCLAHSGCRVSRDRQNPSRLLYIAPDQIRLFINNQDSGKLDYATLSHCWGHMETLRLTKDRLNDFQQFIPREYLCKTFQDAIFVARYFGFSYLWIDSLCIIQDDKKDRAHEAETMSRVYGCSSLNIAASGATDGSQGLFFGRAPHLLRKYRFSIKVNGAQQKYICVDSHTYSRCISTQPLMKRGWALQERILSPRTLHFSKTELFWECRDLSACETYPQAFVMRRYNARDFLYKGVLLDWTTIVKLYSSADLTYSGDKLVAISGLARRFWGRDLHKTYVAGLWREQFPGSLLWFTFSPTRKPTAYRAPTWSWASVDGQIEISHFEAQEILHIKITDLWVKNYGDQFGPVQDSYLQLYCDVLLPGQISTDIHLPKCPIVQFPNFSGKINIFWDYLEAWKTTTSGLFFLPVQTMTGNHYFRTAGLVLQPTDNEAGQYQRLGYFSYFQSGHYDFWIKAMAAFDAAGGLMEHLYAGVTIDEGNPDSEKEDYTWIDPHSLETNDSGQVDSSSSEASKEQPASDAEPCAAANQPILARPIKMTETDETLHAEVSQASDLKYRSNLPSPMPRRNPGEQGELPERALSQTRDREGSKRLRYIINIV